MCMCVCVYQCVSVQERAHAHTLPELELCACMSVWDRARTCAWACAHGKGWACVPGCLCAHVCMCTYAFVCVHAVHTRCPLPGEIRTARPCVRGPGRPQVQPPEAGSGALSPAGLIQARRRPRRAPPGAERGAGGGAGRGARLFLAPCCVAGIPPTSAGPRDVTGPPARRGGGSAGRKKEAGD